LGNTSYPDDPQWNVYNFETATSMRIIIRGLLPVAHPMHMHVSLPDCSIFFLLPSSELTLYLQGHNFWVVAQGTGDWDGKVTRPNNPQRRDTQILERGGRTDEKMSYIVLDVVADNPGVWPLHCHIAWHVSAGLYVNIMVCHFLTGYPGP
jgi:FtsP/CotA-like multicopper oxidase with cupredoxin domain